MSTQETHLFDRFRRYPSKVGQRIAGAIRRALPQDSKPPVLLELGVGTGAMALPLLGEGLRFVGLDSDSEMLRRFHEKVPKGEEVEVLQADARAIPLASASVDGVLVVRFWHLVSEWRQVLAEALRVLRPGGGALGRV